MSAERPEPVSLQLSFDDADPVYLDRQTRMLQRDLKAIGVPVDTVRGEAPEGARGAAEVSGLLQIGLAVAPIVAGRLFDLLQQWIGAKGKSAKLTIKWGNQEIDAANLTAEQVANLVVTLRGGPSPS